MYLGPYQTSKMELFSDNMQWLKAFNISEKRSIIDVFLFFALTAIWLPTANFEPLSRGQLHSPDVNHCIFTFFGPKVTGSLETRSGP